MRSVNSPAPSGTPVHLSHHMTPRVADQTLQYASPPSHHLFGVGGACGARRWDSGGREGARERRQGHHPTLGRLGGHRVFGEAPGATGVLTRVVYHEDALPPAGLDHRGIAQ